MKLEVFVSRAVSSLSSSEVIAVRSILDSLAIHWQSRFFESEGRNSTYSDIANQSSNNNNN